MVYHRRFDRVKGSPLIIAYLNFALLTKWLGLCLLTTPDASSRMEDIAYPLLGSHYEHQGACQVRLLKWLVTALLLEGTVAHTAFKLAKNT